MSVIVWILFGIVAAFAVASNWHKLRESLSVYRRPKRISGDEPAEKKGPPGV